MPPAKQLYLHFEGVQNTVFYQQVFIPLANEVQVQGKQIVVLCFEKDPILANKYLTKLPKIPGLAFVVWRRMPLLGHWVFNLVAERLAHYLAENNFKTVICQGEFAARILQQALCFYWERFELDNILFPNEQRIPDLSLEKIQVHVPGLAGPEALLQAQQPVSFFSKIFAWFKGWYLNDLSTQVEKKVFCDKSFVYGKHILPVEFLFVSKALLNYVRKAFCLTESFLSLLPDPTFAVDVAKKMAVRSKIREALQVAQDKNIYCYVGGLQFWQSFPDNVAVFCEKKQSDAKAFLLVLTKDVLKATEIIKKIGVKPSDYLVISVHSSMVQDYLLACDYGLLVREPNLVNWTSRPMKAMEYLQAGLLILHNYSISWVIQNS